MKIALTKGSAIWYNYSVHHSEKTFSPKVINYDQYRAENTQNRPKQL